MPGPLIVWTLTVLVILAVLTQKRWEPYLIKRGVRVDRWPWRWYLTGYPVTAARIWWTWRRLATLNGLSVSDTANGRVIGGRGRGASSRMVVYGQPLKPKPPRLGVPTPTSNGVRLRALMHPGQTPAVYLSAAQAMTHAWRVHSVRVTSPRRGEVLMTVTATDPLTGKSAAASSRETEASRALSARVGAVEDGHAWVIDFSKTPHLLITGATGTGKSNLLAALVYALAPKRVALVGIDLKGGMELGPYSPRLSALVTDRESAQEVLTDLVTEIRHRMEVCRAAGVRTVWDLPVATRPLPVVILVDEVAELYLTDGSRETRDAADQCGTLLLRIAQLGAGLGLHLVISGQRVGSDLGPRVTALRSQLGGRVAHRAHDAASAEMTLGDIAPDAVIVAQSIDEEYEKGVAVITKGGHWERARSDYIPVRKATEEAQRTAHLNAPLSHIGPKKEKEGGDSNVE